MSGERRVPGLGLVGFLLRCYPRNFRRRFEASLRADAAQALTEARGRGVFSWLRTLIVWSMDAVLSGIAERRPASSRFSGTYTSPPGGARGDLSSPPAASSGPDAEAAASTRVTSRVGRGRRGHSESHLTGGRRWPAGSLLADARHALRLLRRAPGYSLVMVATLALGIGLTTSAYHVANATVLRPLGYPSPERLVRIEMVGEDGRELSKVSGADVADWRERADGFESFAALDFGVVTYSAGDSDPEIVRSGHATSDLFEVLGVRASSGRLFRAQDALTPTGVVLSHAFWLSRLGGVSDVVGRSVVIDGRARTVLGVLRADFEDPSTAEVGQSQVWLPLADEATGDRGSRWLNGIARVSDGVSIERASTQLSAVAAALASEHPESNGGMSTRVIPLREALWGDATAPLLLLVAGTGFILLIACSNLANLSFARGAARQGELAIRRAIGAGRVAVVRQLAVETVVLAVAGGAVGVGLTWIAAQALRATLDGRLQRMAASPDASVIVFAALVTLLSALAVGVLPGLRAARIQPARVLQESSRSALPGGSSRRLRSVLVAGQVALALVLLFGAALLLRSFDQLMRVDPGFDAAGLLVWELTLPTASYPSDGAVLQFQSRLLERLNAIPGAQAGAVDKLPFGTRWGCTSFAIGGEPIPQRAEDWPCAETRSISPGYVDALGIPLVRGRSLRASDLPTSAPVVLVNETFARQTWPQEEALGQRIAWWNDVDTETGWRTVVGVVGDVRHRGLESEPLAEVYMPSPQAPDRRMSYVLRTTGGDPDALASAARAAVRGIDDQIPLRDLRSFDTTIAESVVGLRTGMLSVLALGALALLLAVIGIYGVLAYFVAQRTPEIGLRLALGADARGIARLVIGQGMRSAVVGAILGLFVALALARAMASIVYGVAPTDPVSLLAATALLLAVAALASWLPARRALRVDPTTALRNG